MLRWELKCYVPFTSSLFGLEADLKPSRASRAVWGRTWAIQRKLWWNKQQLQKDSLIWLLLPRLLFWSCNLLWMDCATPYLSLPWHFRLGLAAKHSNWLLLLLCLFLEQDCSVWVLGSVREPVPCNQDSGNLSDVGSYWQGMFGNSKAPWK